MFKLTLTQYILMMTYNFIWIIFILRAVYYLLNKQDPLLAIKPKIPRLAIKMFSHYYKRENKAEDIMRNNS